MAAATYREPKSPLAYEPGLLSAGVGRPISRRVARLVRPDRSRTDGGLAQEQDAGKAIENRV
jgi:hypothetical protein